MNPTLWAVVYPVPSREVLGWPGIFPGILHLTQSCKPPPHFVKSHLKWEKEPPLPAASPCHLQHILRGHSSMSVYPTGFTLLIPQG